MKTFEEIKPQAVEAVEMPFYHPNYSGWRQERWNVKHAETNLAVCEEMDKIVEDGSRNELVAMITWLRARLDLTTEDHRKIIDTHKRT